MGFLIKQAPKIIIAIAILYLIVNLPLSIFNFFRPKPTTATVTNSRTLVNRIQPMGQLVSTNVELAMANIEVKVDRGGPNLCGHEATYVAEASINAGIDLMKLNEYSVQINNQSVLLRLPAPQLTSCDLTYIERYKNSSTICRVDWQSVRFLGEYAALTAFRDEVLENGILEETQRNATRVLMPLIEVLTGSEIVEIEFEETSESEFLSTCDPETPRNWIYDAEKQVWNYTD